MCVTVEFVKCIGFMFLGQNWIIFVGDCWSQVEDILWGAIILLGADPIVVDWDS